MPPPGLPFAVKIVLLLLICAAGVYDVRSRRIPNWLTAGGVVAGIALNSFLYEGWQGLWFSLAGLGAGLGAYLLLYAMRAMGAGDVKLMAAVGALVGVRDWCGIFFITALLGGVGAVVLATIRGRLRQTLWNIGFIVGELKKGRPAWVANEQLDVRNPRSLGLPHGTVIAVATAVFLALGAHFTT